MNKKPVYVAFANKKIEHDFERLNEEKFEDKQLYIFIQRAIDDLKKDPMCGTKISKSLWPKSYINKKRFPDKKNNPTLYRDVPDWLQLTLHFSFFLVFYFVP